MYTSEDFAHSPFLLFYEVTRACDLVCKHCRAAAMPRAHPDQLSREQSMALIDDMSSFTWKPLLVFTGGDPMKREDLMDLIRHAVTRGLEVAVTPSATPLLTPKAVSDMQEAGTRRIAMSIDGASAETHDGIRGVQSSYDRTIEIIKYAREINLPVQVNTTITRRNFAEIDAMADLLGELDIAMWSVFFLIPVGRGVGEERIKPEEYEIAFEKLWTQAQKQKYAVKTTEAHHYRRFVLQQHGNPQSTPQAHAAGNVQRAPLGVNDGRGVMFVSHTGQIYPSGFMPLLCGKFPEQSVVDVYKNSSVFRDLRDADQFHGKCGYCEYRHVCGGSRARAYALTRDHIGAEPDCVYEPGSK